MHNIKNVFCRKAPSYRFSYFRILIRERREMTKPQTELLDIFFQSMSWFRGGVNYFWKSNLILKNKAGKLFNFEKKKNVLKEIFLTTSSIFDYLDIRNCLTCDDSSPMTPMVNVLHKTEGGIGLIKVARLWTVWKNNGSIELADS